jgi:hypothetical protein
MKLVSPLLMHLIHFDLSSFEGINAYWSPSAQIFTDVVGLTVRCRAVATLYLT